jgi:DNA transformation protein and related proteins
MAVSEQFLEYILEQLQRVGHLTSRRMFSGVGLYSGGLFFGLLFKERLYFKTDDTSRPDYEARGSEGFRPRPNTKRDKMTYYTVPAEVLEDGDELVTWARRAVSAALVKESEKAAIAAAASKKREKQSADGAKRKSAPQRTSSSPRSSAAKSALATPKRTKRAPVAKRTR